jgi:hypothetical protein
MTCRISWATLMILTCDWETDKQMESLREGSTVSCRKLPSENILSIYFSVGGHLNITWHSRGSTMYHTYFLLLETMILRLSGVKTAILGFIRYFLYYSFWSSKQKLKNQWSTIRNNDTRGWGGQKSAKKVSSIIWMAPYITWIECLIRSPNRQKIIKAFNHLKIH